VTTQHTLLDRLRADPADESTWSVLRDLLLGEGDPRGVLMVAGDVARDGLLMALAPDWYGRPVKVADGQVVMRADLDDDFAPGVLLGFHRGHARTLRVETTWDGARESWGETWIPDLLRRILSHPTGRLITDVELRATPWNEFHYEGLVEALSGCGPLAVRRFYAGDGDQLSWTNVPDVRTLWAASPHLDEVTLEGSSIALGDLHHDRLRRLTLLSGGLPRDPLRSLAVARLPALESLELWFGDRGYGAECGIDDVRPLLARPFERLTRMALVNCEFADELAVAALDAVWLPQLRELALGKGTLSAVGARALIANARRLSHVTLDVSESYIPADLLRELQSAFPDRLVATGQKSPYQVGGRSMYYVSVGE
jgi:hypothetical protein